MNYLVATGQICSADVYFLGMCRVLESGNFLLILDDQFFQGSQTGLVWRISGAGFPCGHSQPELSCAYQPFGGHMSASDPHFLPLPIALPLACSAYLPVLPGSCRWRGSCSILSGTLVWRADHWTKNEESWFRPGLAIDHQRDIGKSFSVSVPSVSTALSHTSY